MTGVERRQLRPDVGEVAEDEGFLWVESESDDILGILSGQAAALLLLYVLPEKLLVIG